MTTWGDRDYGLAGTPKPGQEGYAEWWNATQYAAPPTTSKRPFWLGSPSRSSRAEGESGGGRGRGAGVLDERAAKRAALLGAAAGAVCSLWFGSSDGFGTVATLAFFLVPLGVAVGWMLGLYWRVLVAAMIALLLLAWSVKTMDESTGRPDSASQSTPVSGR